MSTDIRTHIEACVLPTPQVLPTPAQISCGTPPCHARIPMRCCRSCRVYTLVTTKSLHPVRTHIEACLSCQHRKSSHRPPKLPVGHRSVTRAFQCVAVDLVEYKSLSQGNCFILSAIDHFTRFVALIPIKDKAARTIVHLIERVFSVFGPPETPRQGI